MQAVRETDRQTGRETGRRGDLQSWNQTQRETGGSNFARPGVVMCL